MHYEVLPGLPAYGPLPELFSESGSGTYREGLVVEFHPDSSGPWVGNFQRGPTSYDGVFAHPDKQHLVVISGGSAYVIDPEAKRLVEIFGGFVEACFELGGDLLFSNSIRLDLIGAASSWSTRRLAWDGLRITQITDAFVGGEAYHFDGSWHSFRVLLADGQAFGGAYNGPEP